MLQGYLRADGRDWIERILPDVARQQPVPMGIDELTVGTICGGSDATSGLTANPAMGVAFDLLIADGAKTIFEETGELIGMEHLMAARAANPALGEELKRSVAKAATYYATLGYASFAPGNADGGLTTIEEKSLGAYAKSGQSTIDGIVKPGIEVRPTRVTTILDLPYDTTIHYISVHTHPLAESLELRDVTADKTVFKSQAHNLEGQLGLKKIDYFSSAEGAPVYKDHEYDLISTYNNTTEEDQDSMAVMYVYLLDKEFQKPALGAGSHEKLSENL
jgi:hypothetical protein